MTVTTSRLEQILERIPRPTPEQARAAARTCVAAEGYADTDALRDRLEQIGALPYQRGKAPSRRGTT